jgi:hypothetical protein
VMPPFGNVGAALQVLEALPEDHHVPKTVG